MKIVILGPAHPYRGGLAAIMETMARETFAGYYNSVKFLRNIGNCDHIQARLPFELNIW